MEWNEVLKVLLRTQLHLIDTAVGLLPDPVKTELQKAGKEILADVAEVAREFASPRERKVEKSGSGPGGMHRIDIE